MQKVLFAFRKDGKEVLVTTTPDGLSLDDAQKEYVEDELGPEYELELRDLENE